MQIYYNINSGNIIIRLIINLNFFQKRWLITSIRIRAKTTILTQMMALRKIPMEPNRSVREDPRTITREETSNANTVRRPIFLTLPYIPTWNKNIPKAKMESWGIPQRAAEEEDDQERTHTRDLIQEQKISSRHQREMEAQLIPWVASKRLTWSFLEHQIMMALTTLIQIWLNQKLSKR